MEQPADNYLLKTKVPLCLWLLAGFVPVLIVLCCVFPSLIIYSVAFELIFYYIFCRYACIVCINDEFLTVLYLAPWNTDVEVRTDEIGDIGYEAGLYQLFIGTTEKNYLPRDMRGAGGFFDRLIIGYKGQTESYSYINVNARLFQFGEILKWAKQLKLLRDRVQNGMFY